MRWDDELLLVVVEAECSAAGGDAHADWFMDSVDSGVLFVADP